MRTFTLAAGSYEFKIGSETMLDTTPPTATFGAVTRLDTNRYSVDITLSEPSTNFGGDDVVYTNFATGTVTQNSSTSYSVNFTAASEGPVTISIPAGRFTDAAGNPNLASEVLSFNHDATPPTATISELESLGGARYQATVTLSEPSDNFTGFDLTAVNIAGWSFAELDTMTYSFIVTAMSEGPLSVSIAAGAFTDAAGNSNLASNVVSVLHDITPPTATISALTSLGDGTYSASITLSEASVDFAQEDLALVNATATLSGSGTGYTAVLTPQADGTVSLSIPAGVFTDAAGNANLASDSVSVTHDGTSPGVTLSSSHSEFADPNQPLLVSIIFTETVNGFEAGDIIAGNAMITLLTGGGATYEATLVPTGLGNVTVSVPAGVATDANGNANLASNSLSIIGRLVEETQRQILRFVQTRANNLLRHQPGLIGFMSQKGNGGLSFSTKGGSGQ